MPETFDKPIATVDAVILTVEDKVLKVLLVKRAQAPFAGTWALPGGYIRVGEDRDVQAAMVRVLHDKVGADNIYLEQLGTYSGMDRDPRGFSLTVTHLALVARSSLTFSTDVDAALFPVADLPELAFDHASILGDAVARLKGKGGYSSLPTAFLDATFTLSEMQDAYEVVLGSKLDASSFRRKVMSLDILEDTGDMLRGPRMRPATLYRLRDGVGTFDRTLG